MNIKNLNKNIFLLGAGLEQLQYIKILKESGCFIVAVDINDNAPGFKMVDEYKAISTHNYIEIFKYALKVNKFHPIDHFISFCSGLPQFNALKLSKKFNLKADDHIQIKNILDKSNFKKILLKLNLPIIPYETVESLNGALSACSQIKFPLIVKPSSGGMGSIGVKKINSIDELKSAFEDAYKISTDKKVIIEKFIKGKNFTYTSLISNGIIKFNTIGEKFFHNQGEFIPIGASQGICENIPENIKIKIYSDFELICKFLKLSNTSIRSDIIYDISKEKIYFLEMEIALATPLLLTPVSHEYPLLESLVYNLLDIDISTSDIPKYGAAIKYLVHDYSSAVKIKNIEDLKKIDYLIELDLNTQVYEYLVNGIKKYVWGKIITKGKNMDDAINKATEIENSIEIVYK